jgi:hypothetical protein
VKLQCPKCRQVLISATAVLCVCGAFVPAHSHQADDEPAISYTSPSAGRFTPAAHLYGQIQAVGASGSAGVVTLTLTDAEGNDVTALHQA